LILGNGIIAFLCIEKAGKLNQELMGMNKKLYEQYLLEYVREALIYGNNNVEEAANYLLSQKKPRFFAKQEKRLALERAQKNFKAYTDRPLWFVLKCLGIKEDEIPES
jgi:hypothetical protein